MKVIVRNDRRSASRIPHSATLVAADLLRAASIVVAFVCASAAITSAPASAQDAAVSAPTALEASPSDATSDEAFAAHLQLTNVTQRHPRFNAPYSGTNSLSPIGRTEETTDITAYLGARLWKGAEFWVNPEVDQGFGFDKTVGAAGFPSGEAYKVGADAPYLRVPRFFVRQTFSLGGDAAPAEPAANVLGRQGTANKLVLTVGKFSVVDVFDTNTYAHDPRGDFLNWSIIDAGPFDYAADAWGFTYGASAELSRGAWTTRVGYFQLSRVPNGKVVAVDFSQSSFVGEVEHRHQWFGADGKVKLLAFVNRAPMGRYADAVALAQQTGTTPDTAAVRKRASRPGISLNVEQSLTGDVGAFLRVSANSGDKEAYEFTEINRSASGGFAIEGKRWGRPDDTWGVAAVVNQLSHAARDYFAAGGLGILIGDGRLNYADEKMLETYYAIQLASFATLSLDYQRLVNPAYNRDRGPVSVYSARLHLEH